MPALRSRHVDVDSCGLEEAKFLSVPGLDPWSAELQTHQADEKLLEASTLS